MKYKGIELKEFKSDKPVVFDPPKKMICWDDSTYTAIPQHVCAFVPNREEGLSAVICTSAHWQHCAEISEKIQKFRRATNSELMKWLTQGNGIYKFKYGDRVMNNIMNCAESMLDDNCNYNFVVRKWDDTEWHEPTVDYMEL